MKHIFIRIIISLVCLIATGCDYHNFYNFKVNNQTGKNIKVNFKDIEGYSDTVKTAQISSGTAAIISTHGVTSGRKGSAPDLYTDSVYQFSFFQIQRQDSIIARKSFLRRTHWEYTVNEATGEYKLTIDSSDFR